jgi:hypothetical protein
MKLGGVCFLQKTGGVGFTNGRKMISKIFLKDNINDNKKSNLKKCIQNNLSYFFLAELLFISRKKINRENELSKKKIKKQNHIDPQFLLTC